MTGRGTIGLRLLSGTALALALVLFGATAAYACNEPRINVSEEEAKAGDRVHFTIDNTQPGAEYKVWLDGEKTAEGVDNTPESGVEGELRMPDLGSEPRENVEVASLVEHRSIVHGDEEYEPSSDFIDYRVPATTQQREETPPDEEPPPSKPGAGPGDGTEDNRRETPERNDGVDSRENRDRFSPLATPVARHQAERDRAVGAGRTAPSVPGDGDATSGGESPSGESRSRGVETGERSLASGTRAAARENARATRAPGRPALASPHDAPITEIGATRPVHAVLPAPSALVLGLTLLALVASSVIAVVAVRRRRGGPNDPVEASTTPPWVPPVVDAETRARDLLIEAELQEMIAEHRAHELVSSAPVEPAPEPFADDEVPAGAGATAERSLAGVG